MIVKRRALIPQSAKDVRVMQAAGHNRVLRVIIPDLGGFIGESDARARINPRRAPPIPRLNPARMSRMAASKTELLLLVFTPLTT